MSRLLDDLSPEMRSKAVELLARLVEARIPVVIVDTRRTAEEHATNLRRGVSWVLRSKHLDGDAIDIVPLSQYDVNGSNKLLWDAAAPVWSRIGRIGESLGLRWGGRWTKKDMGHFELVRDPAETVRT